MPKKVVKSAVIELSLAKPAEYKGELPKALQKRKFLYAEPKLDGLRGIAICLAGKVKLYTAGGVEVVNGPKIVEALHFLHFLHTPFFGNRVYDGEFFTKDWNLSSSIVKTLTPDHSDRNKLRFRIFDQLQMEEWNACKGIHSLRIRKAELEKLRKYSNKYKTETKGIQVIEVTAIAPLDTVIQDYYKKQIEGKYEGAVLKDPKSVYSFKRSKDWLKLKPTQTSDLKIVDVKEGTGRNKGRLGAFFCEGKIAGIKVKTKVGGGLTDALRDEFWTSYKKGKLIGTIIEVRHEGLTRGNAVRFPSFVRERWDKSKPN